MKTRLVSLRDEDAEDLIPNPVPPPPPPPPVPSVREDDKEVVAAWSLVTMGLKVLSQRTVQLAGHVLPFIALSFFFVLAWNTRHDPSILQLLQLVIFGTFAVTIIMIRR